MCGRIAALLMRMSTRPNSESALQRHRLDLILLCHIGDDRDGPDTERLRFADDRVGFRSVGACIDDDMRALAGEMQHSSPADIAARASNQGDLPPKFTHDTSLDFIRDVEESASNGNNIFHGAVRANVSRISQRTTSCCCHLVMMRGLWATCRAFSWSSPAAVITTSDATTHEERLFQQRVRKAHVTTWSTGRVAWRRGSTRQL
jgi:hypothetical protein